MIPQVQDEEVGYSEEILNALGRATSGMSNKDAAALWRMVSYCAVLYWYGLDIPRIQDFTKKFQYK